MKIFIALVALLSCADQGISYRIEGSISDSDVKMVYLEHKDHFFKDSVKVVDNKFYFTGTEKYPTSYLLNIGKPVRYPIIVEDGTTRVSIVNDSATITGGTEQSILNELSRKENSLYKKWRKASKEGKRSEAEKILHDEILPLYATFSVKNINSFIGLETLFHSRFKSSRNKITHALNQVDSDKKKSPFYDGLNYYLKTTDLDSGSNYIDFTMYDYSGNKYTLSSLISNQRPTLLIFGGLGCMREHGRQTLNEFDLGFGNKVNIIVAMFSTSRSFWTHEQSLSYVGQMPVYSDLQGELSKTRIDYGVHGTPTVCVIDKNGIIIYKSPGYSERVNKVIERIL